MYIIEFNEILIVEVRKYDDIGDAFQDAESEGDVKKTIAIVSKEYNQ